MLGKGSRGWVGVLICLTVPLACPLDIVEGRLKHPLAFFVCLVFAPFPKVKNSYEQFYGFLREPISFTCPAILAICIPTMIAKVGCHNLDGSSILVATPT